MDTESAITEEAFGQIRSTIGKTQLFINQRFKQFIGLVDDCEHKRGPKETKVEDLQGFWDMIFYQVEDLHHSFKLLTQLKDNEWRELEVVKPVPLKRAPKPVSKPLNTTAKPIVRSKIREQIMNLKNKQCEQKSDKNESFGEKENQKIETSVSSEAKKKESNAKSIEKYSESESLSSNVLKRTPLRVALKK